MNFLARSLRRSMTALMIMLFLGAARLSAAEDPRNELGVAFNHVSVIATGPLYEQETEFWKKMGGQSRQPGTDRFVIFAFPDMSVTVRDAEGSGGTVGSVVDHIGFQVPNTDEAMTRFEAAGLKTERGPNPGQGFVTSPVGVRVEILQDPQLTAMRGHHVHFFVTAPLEMQAWYAQNFGAVPGKRGNFDAANITANTTVMNLTFGVAEVPRAPTKGRALARVGFLVNGVDAFLKKLEGQQAVIDRPTQLQQDGRTGIAYIIDPWGNWVELIDRNAGSGRP